MFLLAGASVSSMAQTIEMLSFYPSISSDSEQVGYLYIDTQGRKLTDLRLRKYDNALTLEELEEIDLLPFVKDPTFQSEEIVEFSTSLADGQVYQLVCQYEGDESPSVSAYHEGLNRYDYMSDLPYTSNNSTTLNTAINGSTLQITSQKYKKGFGNHAIGFVQTVVTPGKYHRFITDVGKQSGQPYIMAFSLSMDNELLAQTEPINNSVKVSWDYPIGDNTTSVRINTLYGDNGPGNDHGTIGGARLYYTPTVKKPQTIQWIKEMELHDNKPFELPLQAVAGSGLAVRYRIAKGAEYASIERDSVLRVHTPSGKADIIVEAYQPGDTAWLASEIAVCTFRVVRGLEVRKDQRVELANGERLEELIVFADASESGQVTVKDGIANVKKLILKYTFMPETWNFITFPTDMNIDKISNLNELGYYLNNQSGGRGAYHLYSYDTESRADNPSGVVWQRETSAEVQGLKGYIMKLDNALGNEPVEVTFTINNVALDFESTIRPLTLSLDLSTVEPGTQQNLYIKPANVKGNTLKVTVDFRPQDLSGLPINHARALEQMRITYTPNREGIRLTLPDQTPAKVAFYDRKGKKLIKAVRYISPLMIDLSDMKPGTYQMVVNYGPAFSVRELMIKN